MKKSNYLFVYFLLLIALTGCKSSLYDEMVSEASVICDGGKLPESSPYNPEEQQIHYILLVSEDNSGFAMSPKDWIPENLEQTQLVACLQTLTLVEIEKCVYDNGSQIPLVEERVEIILYESLTGNEVARLVAAPENSHCPGQTSMGEKDIFGNETKFLEEVYSDEILQQLKEYVNP